TDWPNVWPPPESLTLTVERGGTRLILPVIAGPPPQAERPAFATPRRERDPDAPDPGARGVLGQVEPAVWRVERDVLGRESRVVIEHGSEDLVERGARSIERYRGATGVSTDYPG